MHATTGLCASNFGIVQYVLYFNKLYRNLIANSQVTL